MKVLIVEPGKYPREADIEHTLEAEQAVVGGTIEAVYPWRFGGNGSSFPSSLQTLCGAPHNVCNE